MVQEARPKTIHLVIALIVCLFLILLDSIHALEGVYTSVNYVTTPVKLFLYNTSGSFNDFAYSISNLAQIRDDNLRLQSELLEKNNTIADLLIIQEENEKLREQLKLQEVGEFSLLEARVIGGDPRIESFILLDKGTKDGVKEEQIVVFGKYAVGEIVQTDGVSSKVKLISSPDSNIPARTLSSESSSFAKGLVKGSVENSLVMENILAGEIITSGDTVISTGIDSNYPFGLILGEVIDIEDIQTETTKTAKLKLSLDFRDLDIVFIILEE